MIKLIMIELLWKVFYAACDQCCEVLQQTTPPSSQTLCYSLLIMDFFFIATAQHFNFLPNKFTMQIIIKIAIFFLHCSRLVAVLVAFYIKMQMHWINLHVAPLSAIISDSLLRPFSHCCCWCYWCWQTMRCFCFWKGFSLTVVELGSIRRGRQREKCHKNSCNGGIFSCACVKASSFRCACRSTAGERGAS